MDCWTPPPDQPQLLDWWRPLLAFARAARDDEAPWPVHLDEFRLLGRVDRQDRPSVWMYRHQDSRRDLLIDDHGRPQRFIVHRTGASRGRFAEIEIRPAIWQAGLPETVTPVSYHSEDRRGDGDLSDGWADDEPAEATPPPAPRRRHSPRSRSRARLRLVSSDTGS